MGAVAHTAEVLPAPAMSTMFYSHKVAGTQPEEAHVARNGFVIECQLSSLHAQCHAKCLSPLGRHVITTASPSPPMLVSVGRKGGAGREEENGKAGAMLPPRMKEYRQHWRRQQAI